MRNLFCERLAAYMCVKKEPSFSLEQTKKEMINDWMLAAAVLSRICAIVFTIILLGGTAVFFCLFAFHP